MDGTTAPEGAAVSAASNAPVDSASAPAAQETAASQNASREANTPSGETGGGILGNLETNQESDASQNASRGAANAEATERQAPVDPLDLPITDFSKVDLQLGKEANNPLLAAFGEQVVKMGLSTRQARELAHWQMSAQEHYLKQQAMQGASNLKAEWGANAERNRMATMELITTADRVTNGAFSKALDECGATCNESVIKGLHYISTLIAEDKLGSKGGQQSIVREETPLEALQGLFKVSK